MFIRLARELCHVNSAALADPISLLAVLSVKLNGWLFDFFGVRCSGLSSKLREPLLLAVVVISVL